MIPLARRIDRYRREECKRSNNRKTPADVKLQKVCQRS